MAQYGIEMYADTGLKFVIPDYSGFVFHSYVDVQLNTKTWGNEVFYTLWMAAGAQGVAFYRITGRSPNTGNFVPTICYQHIGNQLNFSYIFYHPAWSPSDYVTVRMYFFTNKEVRADNTPYGIQVFDEGGNIVYHTSSKPLRLQVANWGWQDGWAVDVGHGVAAMCNRLGQRGVVVQQPPVFMTHINNIIGIGEGTVLKVALSYQQTIPQPVSADSNIDPEIYYINTGYYD